MITTYLKKRWGGGGQDPTEADLLAALTELYRTDSEHPDCWLSDQNGWTIAAHESGRIILENPEEGEGPWHIPNADQTLILTLWSHLQSGDMSAIHTYPWKEGYR